MRTSERRTGQFKNTGLGSLDADKLFLHQTGFGQKPVLPPKDQVQCKGYLFGFGHKCEFFHFLEDF